MATFYFSWPNCPKTCKTSTLGTYATSGALPKENARIAANLETRRDDLKAIFVTAMRELVANDLTFADLCAFERD